ncbi:predicted protein [Histoplasma capsulatum G186AR]|uniref:Uncharacterized protein n=1 Tax=Ajellomyces capsulatus (strain G186AR / H82 / ATCC MYA-2454 / RMSCC 2432) TaxID=447093 RepID=C0NG86_AJECG|nr:uncharacterized protein HCBG_01902 [Histoplasma capsulatum G186AR]EEH10257.1 predicted protein [Histoplasma capsulatum G186AR]
MPLLNVSELDIVLAPEFGITYPRLVELGFLVLFLQRLPAILVLYKLTPKSVQELEGGLVREILWSNRSCHGFSILNMPATFSPSSEKGILKRLISPVLFPLLLVLFLIVFHGLSIPIHNIIYKIAGIKPIVDKAGQVLARSHTRAKASGTYQALTMGEVETAKEESISSSSQLSRGQSLGHGKRASILRIAEANKCDRN